MRSILSPEHAGVIEAIARDRALLAFDFDGTLAPIVDDRARAAMRPETWALLRVAALLYPCVVVSGRSRADLAPRLDRVPLVAFVGNHGAEAGFGPVDQAPRRTVAAWHETLARRLAGLRGVEIEDKGLSIAIHYRRAPDPGAAARLARDAAGALAGARVFGGHMVVNAVPEEASTKGEALAGLLARVGRWRALYVGDDTTDEDAFLTPGVVGVRVGPAAASAAAYGLASQEAIEDLLAALVGARRRLDSGTARIDGLVRAVRRV